MKLYDITHHNIISNYPTSHEQNNNLILIIIKYNLIILIKYGMKVFNHPPEFNHKLCLVLFVSEKLIISTQICIVIFHELMKPAQYSL